MQRESRRPPRPSCFSVHVALPCACSARCPLSRKGQGEEQEAKVS